MATKPMPAKAMGVITIGWNQYVLPVKDAAQIMQALESAELYEAEGYGDDKMHFIGGEGPNIKFELLSEPHYLQGKFAGPKSQSSKTNDV
jgi:hypothetical protein